MTVLPGLNPGPSEVIRNVAIDFSETEIWDLIKLKATELFPLISVGSGINVSLPVGGTI